MKTINKKSNNQQSFIRKYNNPKLNNSQNTSKVISQIQSCSYYIKGCCKFGNKCLKNHNNYIKVLDYQFNQKVAQIQDDQKNDKCQMAQNLAMPEFNLVVSFSMKANAKTFQQIFENIYVTYNNGSTEIWIESLNSQQSKQLNTLTDNIKDIDPSNIYRNIDLSQFEPKAENQYDKLVADSKLNSSNLSHESSYQILEELRKIQIQLNNLEEEKKNSIQISNKFNEFKNNQSTKNTVFENKLNSLENLLQQLTQDSKKASTPTGASAKPPTGSSKKVDSEKPIPSPKSAPTPQVVNNNDLNENQIKNNNNNQTIPKKGKLQKKELGVDQKKLDEDISQDKASTLIFCCGCGSSKKGFSSFSSLRTHFYQQHNGVAPKGSTHDLSGNPQVSLMTPQQKQISKVQDDESDGKQAIQGLKARFQEDATQKKRKSSLSKCRQKFQKEVQAENVNSEEKTETRNNHFREKSDSDQYLNSTNFKKLISEYEVSQSKVLVYGGDGRKGSGFWYSKSQDLEDRFLNQDEQSDC